MTPADDQTYTFGDSSLAERRLELLADTFAPSTERFLRKHGPAAPLLAVDLGCGPGRTTALLARTLRPARVIGVEASRAYATTAARRLEGTADVLCADVLNLPAAVADADVILARFLLTHLAEPLTSMARWAGRLSARGVLLIEEVESITTTEPTLDRYLQMQRQMLHANKNVLEIGPILHAALTDQAVPHVSSQLTTLTPTVSRAARLFRMNFETWRQRPQVTEQHAAAELEELATALQSLANRPARADEITWQLRQIVLRRPRTT